MKRFFNGINFKNLHCHIDKSNVINKKILIQSNVHMQEKWKLMKDIKKKYTEQNVFERMEKT